jgi:hypothetical protein
MLSALGAGEAHAHAGDRGFVLLLPTGYYMIGGALAVAASFVILALVPAAPLERLARCRPEILRLRADGRTVVSLLSFLVLATLLYAGVAGSRDPLSNPLPLVFWTVWWVGLTLLVGIFGNLWRWLEPWYGPARLLLRDADRPPLILPEKAGYWPAIVLFFAFAWFELVYPAPEDPQRLALVLAVYWIANFAGILLFGHRAWTGRVECFSVFFAMVARLSPFGRAAEGALTLSLPGARAAGAEPLPVSGALFLLLALASVSFDGLSRTFFWLGLLGINPLEFPGRSAVLWSGTFGLLGAFLVLSLLFFGCVRLGQALARGGVSVSRAAGALVWSLLPIALAYHFAHYLTALVINGQYALAAISDPLSRGWNLFGTAGYHVLAGATAGHESAWLIWNAQAAAIIAGHIVAVAIAHVAAFRLHGGERTAAFAELPLALLMVGYTVFGLWLLSTPTGY